jgi:hypothetical protein
VSAIRKKSLTAKDAEVAKEEKGLTAKDAKAANNSIINTSSPSQR